MKKEISVKLRNGESYPSPSQEVREIMMIELKAFFAKELEDDLEPWRDLAACLWFALQNTYFFKKEKVLIKIKEPEEDRENAHFKFNVFFLKRPDLHPTFNPKWKDPYFADWTDPESDDDLEGPDEEIFSCLSVCLEIIQMDTLQKCSAFMLAKMKKSPEALIVGDKPLPKQILNLILSFISQDLCK